MAKVKFIPDGYHTVTPALVVKGGKKAIEFYKSAFGAKEISIMYNLDGQTIMHAEIQIGDSRIMLSDESKEMGALSPQTLGGTPGSLNIYVEDCDATIKRATTAGAKIKMPASDMFWGDRYGKVEDPFGHGWGILTHKEDVTPAEMEKRGKEWMASMAKG
jgi:PhnB protein